MWPLGTKRKRGHACSKKKAWIAHDFFLQVRLCMGGGRRHSSTEPDNTSPPAEHPIGCSQKCTRPEVRTCVEVGATTPPKSLTAPRLQLNTPLGAAKLHATFGCSVDDPQHNLTAAWMAHTAADIF